MKNISYISASAGSGKTYTLTEQLATLIGQGKADPRQVILTTFTRKAAEDFKERSKQKLFEHGLYSQAAMLDEALIGTIHSVANSFISKYWFYLGLSPHTGIMAEDDADLYRSQSLSSLATSDEIRRLRRFAWEFRFMKPKRNGQGMSNQIDDDFWRGPLTQIISFSTNYGITDYARSRSESKAFYRRFVVDGIPPMPAGDELKSLISRLEQLLELEKKNATSDKRKARLRELAKMSRRPSAEFYSSLGRLIASLPAGTRSHMPELDTYAATCSSIWQTRGVYDLVEGYIDLMFDLAERWHDRFAEFKRVNNLLDYNDLEKYFLQLLHMPESSAEIAREFRYVFVDEFQDCSPIQVKIFERLSELVEHSWWVGDAKQAIYGFRGTDTQLTDAIVDIIERGEAADCSLSTLSTSYRSVPAVVDFCNKLFTRVFEGSMPADKVCLKAHRKPVKGFTPLEVWRNCDKDVLTAHITSMVDSGIHPADIAVLDRRTDPLADVAAKLAYEGIPVNFANFPLAQSYVCRLACALLSIVDNDANYLAKAEAAYLMKPGMDTEFLIEQVLGSVDEEGRPDLAFLDRIAPIERLRDISSRLRHQSIGSLTESLFLELNLFESAAQCFSIGEDPTGVLLTIQAEAAAYEERCSRLGIVPAISGFVSYLLDPDNGVMLPGNPEGVQLFTMHASKGLQWKNVIVTSLKSDPSNPDDCLKKDILGTHYHRVSRPAAGNLYPDVYVTLLPSIYGGGRTNVPEPIRSEILNSDLFRQALINKVNEESRLLYVAMTRAADRLILAEEGRNAFAWLKAIGAGEFAGAETLHGSYGFAYDRCDRVATDDDITDSDPSDTFDPEVTYTYPVPATRATYLRRDYSPSQVSGTSPVAWHLDFGHRIPIGPLPEGIDESHLGNCIHHIFELHESSAPLDSKAIRKVIADYGLAAVLPDADAIAQSWANLLSAIADRHGAIAAHRHERHFVHHSAGRIFTGSIDLTVDTAEGLVVIDYKSCPMGIRHILDPDGSHYAGHYGGQLRCYADALAAAGERPVATYVYYPVAGLLTQLQS